MLDDEETVLKFVSRALGPQGFVVHTTSDPQGALELLEANSPALLFCDYHMPTMTGQEFYRCVVDAHPSMRDRFVFLSGDVTGEEIHSFLLATGTVAVSKPIGVKELRELVAIRLGELGAMPGVG